MRKQGAYQNQTGQCMVIACCRAAAAAIRGGCGCVRGSCGLALVGHMLQYPMLCSCQAAAKQLLLSLLQPHPPPGAQRT